MGFWDKFFKKNSQEKPIETQTNHQYPLEELGKLVGQLIEVYYIDRDEEKKELAFLQFPPGEDHFYVGLSAGSYHIIHWDKPNMGNREVVKLIKDKEGRVIYDNPHVPYDFDKPKESESKQNIPDQ